MKLLQELQQLKEEIDKQQQLLSQQVAASEKHQLQETRLKSTIAQQTKLIDYLQGSGKSPESRGFGRLKVCTITSACNVLALHLVDCMCM